MTALQCVTLTGDQWQAVIDAFALMFALSWLMSVGWGQWLDRLEWRWRRHHRRMRRQRSRAVKA